MSQRPRFEKVPEYPDGKAVVSAKAFNDLVDFYNELADAYEELYVKDHMRTDVIGMADSRITMILGSLAEGHEMKIEEEGYEKYKQAVLSGERQTQNQHKTKAFRG